MASITGKTLFLKSTSFNLFLGVSFFSIRCFFNIHSLYIYIFLAFLGAVCRPIYISLPLLFTLGFATFDLCLSFAQWFMLMVYQIIFHCSEILCPHHAWSIAMSSSTRQGKLRGTWCMHDFNSLFVCVCMIPYILLSCSCMHALERVHML